jgi:uncharacterized protein
MKKILLILSLIINFLYADIKDTFPKLMERVVDQAGVLSPKAKEDLNKILKEEEDKTSNQIVVVILNSLNGYSIEEYALELGRYWGIGQKDKNNGVLLVASMEDRKIRIEVGYGLEGALTDKISHDIIEYSIKPNFKAKQYEVGILEAVNQIRATIKGEFVAKGGSSFNILIPLSYFILFFISFFSNSYFVKNKNQLLNRITFSTFTSSAVAFIIYLFAPVILYFSEPLIKIILTPFLTNYLSFSSFFVFIVIFIFTFINNKVIETNEEEKNEIYKNSSKNTYTYEKDEIKQTSTYSFPTEKEEVKSTSSSSNSSEKDYSSSSSTSSSSGGFFGGGGSFGGGGASGGW